MIISPDNYLINAFGEYEWTPERCASAWERADHNLQVGLRWGGQPFSSSPPQFQTLVLTVGIPGAGKSTWLSKHAKPGVLYLDATLTAREVRAKYVTMAKLHGACIHAVVFLTPLHVCLQRNAQRPKERQVPWSTLKVMHEQFKEQPVLATEGFSEIFVVR